MIKILDCTLRDGGHVIGCNFGHNIIHQIVSALVKSRCDIIELGFLMDEEYHPDYSIFNKVAQAEQFVIPSENVEYALMMQQDQYDPVALENCDGTIQNIRVSFHTYDKREGLERAKIIKDKGYKLHINPIDFVGYSKDDMLDMIDKINVLQPHTLSIVDSFGSLLYPQLNEISEIFDEYLDGNISVALHLHENLASSFVLAQHFIHNNLHKRDISVDASIDGMGKIPGNMPIELMMDYANKYLDKNYDTLPLASVNAQYISPIKDKFRWGYSLPFAIAAQRNAHRSYAAFALDNNLPLTEIYRYLYSLEDDKKSIYCEAYAKEMLNKLNDTPPCSTVS
jgi:4-hydroxy 2-oxovalerate aldolase